MTQDTIDAKAFAEHLEAMQANEPTLRDRFAMAALAGIMSRGLMKDEVATDVAPVCYLYADACMKERAK